MRNRSEVRTQKKFKRIAGFRKRYPGARVEIIRPEDYVDFEKDLLAFLENVRNSTSEVLVELTLFALMSDVRVSL